MIAVTSAERVRTALDHRQPDRVPMDFGGSFVTGMHISCVASLRRRYGLDPAPVRLLDRGQFLGEIADDLREAMGLDTQNVGRLMTRFGFPNADWKPWRTYDGLEILVPGRFNTTVDENGDTLIYPQGDLSATPSAKMPKGGCLTARKRRRMSSRSA